MTNKQRLDAFQQQLDELKKRIVTLEARAGIGASATTPVRSLRFVNTESKTEDTLAELTAEEAALLKQYGISADLKRFSLQIQMRRHEDKQQLYKLITSIRNKRNAQVGYIN